MSFTEAIGTCFRKYVTFSGRASRPEYWWFFLFILLGTLAAGILDSTVFGTGAATSSLDTSDGFSAGFSAESNGPLGLLFGLGTLLPILAAGWRRMHDTGRSGLHLFYPLIVMVGLGSFAAFTGLTGFEPAAGDNVPLYQSLVKLVFAIGAFVFVISPLIVLWWLTRPSQPGNNEYGPNPHEVPT